MFPAATPPGTSVESRRNIEVLLLENNRTSSLEVISLLRAAHRHQNTSFLHVKASAIPGSQGKWAAFTSQSPVGLFSLNAGDPLTFAAHCPTTRDLAPLQQLCQPQRSQLPCPERSINVRPCNESATGLGCIAGWAGPLVRDRKF